MSGSDRRTIAAAETSALSVLSRLRRTSHNWGLIHGDLRPSNLLVTESGLTVIDFDDSGFSWYLHDFAAALTFYEHREIAQQLATHWISGYRETLALDRNDLETAAALSLIRRLTMLGWATTHRADALPADLWDENLPGTVEVAARYLRHPLWLVEPVR